MTRDTDRTAALRSELIGAIATQTGMREDLALPFANAVLDYLQAEYPGQQLYIPSPPRQYDVLQIRAMLEREPVTVVCRVFHISRRTLARLVPDYAAIGPACTVSGKVAQAAR